MFKMGNSCFCFFFRPSRTDDKKCELTVLCCYRQCLDMIRKILLQLMHIKVENYSSKLTDKAKGLKIGIPKEYRVDNMPNEIDKLWKKGIDYLKDAGAIIKNISLPHTKYALPAYYIVAPAEASSNLARYDGVKYGHRSKGNNLVEMYENTRSEGFGDEVKRRILIGTYVLSSGYYDAYYLKAQKIRQLIKERF